MTLCLSNYGYKCCKWYVLMFGLWLFSRFTPPLRLRMFAQLSVQYCMFIGTSLVWRHWDAGSTISEWQLKHWPAIECCHDDNYVLCRHEHWHWFSCLSLDFCCSIPVRIVYRRHCLPFLAYCPFLCLFWLQMWECILSSWICGLLSVQTVRWRCWVDDTLLLALNQCLQSCCADHSPVWCWVTWITYHRHMHLIERYRYYQRCLRAILNIHWSDFITNIEVLEMAKVTSIEAMLLKTQLRWAGHASRMEEHRLPKIVL